MNETNVLPGCPHCPVFAVWRCVQRLVRRFPRRYYKRFSCCRLTVWVFPFWWSGGDAVVGKSVGPITYLLKPNNSSSASREKENLDYER